MSKWIENISSRDAKDERLTKSPLAKFLAWIVLILLGVSLFATLQSLTITPSYNKFALENIGLLALAGAVVFGLILSGLQKDIFWPTKRLLQNLDERQLYERNWVFEKSYRIAAIASIVTLLLFGKFLSSVSVLIANGAFQETPGRLIVVAWIYVTFIFTLPLAVASLSRQK